MKNKQYSKLDIVIGVSLCILFACTRIYHLFITPSGLHVDEAAIGYNAYCIANYGVDRYLENWPLVIRNFSGSQSPLYVYMLALAIKLVGYYTSLIRIPALMFSAITFIFGTEIAREIYGRKGAYLAAFLITICPYFIQASHVGLDCNLYLGCFAVAVYSLIYAVKQNKGVFWALSGAAFGMILYSYALSFVAVPLFLILAFGYLLLSRKLSVRHTICFGIPLSLLAFPMILFVMVNLDLIPPIMTEHFSIIRLVSDRASELSFANVAVNIKNIVRVLFVNDGLTYNAFEPFGTLFYFSIPIAFVGLLCMAWQWIGSMRKKEYSPKAFVVFLFIAVFVVTLMVDTPRINRANAIYLALVLFLVEVIYWMYQKKRWLGYAVIALYLISFGFFSYKFFVTFNEDHELLYMYDDRFTEAVANAKMAFPEKNGYYCAKLNGTVAQPQIYLMEYYTPNPYDYQYVNDPYFEGYTHYDDIYFQFPNAKEEYDENAVYMINTSILWDTVEYQNILSELGFTFYEYSGYRIYYKG